MKIIGYHSTKLKAYRKIIINGFNPVKYKNHYNHGRVITWFTKEPQFLYGDICIKVNLTGFNCNISDDLIICYDHYIPSNRIIGKLEYSYLEKIQIFDRDKVIDLFY